MLEHWLLLLEHWLFSTILGAYSFNNAIIVVVTIPLILRIIMVPLAALVRCLVPVIILK